MSTIGKYQKKGFFIDPDEYRYRTRHKTGTKHACNASDKALLIDKDRHLYNNDSVYIFDSDDENDDELYYGINKRAWDFDGDFDDFKYDIFEYDF